MKFKVGDRAMGIQMNDAFIPGVITGTFVQKNVLWYRITFDDTTHSKFPDNAFMEEDIELLETPAQKQIKEWMSDEV